MSPAPAPAEFACRDCGHHVTTQDRAVQDTTCERPPWTCRGLYRRVFHPPTVSLTGPGFYSTDNKKGRC